MGRIKILGQAARGKRVKLPLYECPIPAGFPSPAEDYMGDKLDLNDLLIKKPAATFFVRVEGDSMTGAHINHNDILVVDRSLTPKHGDIVIAEVDGELMVKRLHLKGRVMLCPENDRYRPIPVSSESELAVWGVATSVIHPLR